MSSGFLLQKIAEFVCSSTMNALSADERQVLRAHAIDAAVAFVAGVHSPEGHELLGLAPHAPAEQAALAAAVIRSTEVDDIHIASCVTPTSVAMPAAYLAQGSGEGGVEDALRIAVELSVRMGMAIDGPNALYRGIWPTCFATPFAVAAALSRLRHLDPARTSHALSLALMMSSGRIGRFAGQPTGRWIILNAAFVDGVRAVDAAELGFKGDPSLLDGPWLENILGFAPRLDILSEGLPGTRALQGLGLKPFSTARQALSPTQAVIDLLAEGLDPQTIESIEVRVPQAYEAMISRPLEPYRSATYSNVAFQIALAVLRPDQLLDLDRSSVIKSAEVLDFAKRVTVVADPSLQEDYPRVWGGEVEVTHSLGKSKKRVLAPVGDSANRLTPDLMRDKHMRLLTDASGAGAAAELLSCLHQMFEQPQPAIALMRSAFNRPSETR